MKNTRRHHDYGPYVGYFIGTFLGVPTTISGCTESSAVFSPKPTIRRNTDIESKLYENKKGLSVGNLLKYILNKNSISE